MHNTLEQTNKAINMALKQNTMQNKQRIVKLVLIANDQKIGIYTNMKELNKVKNMLLKQGFNPSKITHTEKTFIINKLKN